MQNLMPSANGSYYCSIREVWSQMVKKEGVLRPIRGIGAVVLGAGPAHALYFSSYEYLRDVISQHSILNTTLSSGMFLDYCLIPETSKLLTNRFNETGYVHCSIIRRSRYFYNGCVFKLSERVIECA